MDKLISCMIFDLDGVLFFTEEANKHAYMRAFNEENIPFDEKKFQDVSEHHYTTFLRVLCPSITDEEIIRIRMLKANYYKEEVSRVRENEILLGFIRSFKNTVKICLATSASRTNMDFLLKHFGVDRLFDYVVCGDDIGSPKPDPECLIRCMEKFQLSPEECLVFEDSEIGIQTALNAGMPCLRVSTIPDETI